MWLFSASPNTCTGKVIRFSVHCLHRVLASDLAIAILPAEADGTLVVGVAGGAVGPPQRLQSFCGAVELLNLEVAPVRVSLVKWRVLFRSRPFKIVQKIQDILVLAKFV